MKKRALSLIMLLPLYLWGQSAELRVLPVEANRDEIVGFPVNFHYEGLPTGTALQFDITWDSLFAAELDPQLNQGIGTSHAIDYELIDDSILRVIVYSLSNETISVNALISLQVRAQLDLNTQVQPLRVSNLHLSGANGERIDVSSKELRFVFPRDAAGIFGPSKSLVELSWEPIEGANGYEIYRAGSNDVTRSALVGKPSGNSFRDENVGNTIYYYWISAIYEDGKSSLSQVLEVIPVPSRPGNFIVANALHPSGPQLNWTILDSPDKVQVLRSIGESLAGAEVLAELTADSSSYTDSAALGGIPYSYWIRGVNEFGSGPSTTGEKGISLVADSFEKVEASLSFEGDSILLSWKSATSDNFAIAHSTDLINWQILDSSIQSVGETVTWADFEELGLGYPSFFRVYSVEQ